LGLQGEGPSQQGRERGEVIRKEAEHLQLERVQGLTEQWDCRGKSQVSKERENTRAEQETEEELKELQSGKRAEKQIRKAKHER
jgi:hypothetical protein